MKLMQPPSTIANCWGLRTEVLSTCLAILPMPHNLKLELAAKSSSEQGLSIVSCRALSLTSLAFGHPCLPMCKRNSSWVIGQVLHPPPQVVLYSGTLDQQDNQLHYRSRL